MSTQTETAYITGAASGLAKAVAEMLVKKGVRVFLADRDTAGVASVAAHLNTTFNSSSPSNPIAFSTTLDAASWPSQVSAFTLAVSTLGRIDHVYPIAGIGERRWLPKHNPDVTQGFEQPDLTVLDVDLTGVLYTVGIAVQQFRRQSVRESGFRGRIGCVASVCGFYCSPTLPVYTAAKHGIIGFVRSYGKYLPAEKIAINAVCPSVVRTNISTAAFYDQLEGNGLLTPLEGVVETFEMLLDGDAKDVSGEIFEVGPNYGKDEQRAVNRAPSEFLDEESRRVVDLLEGRGRVLQVP